ncbi:C-C motif chemokine 5-like [Parambassis ranga]|uniref:C-C motif chemokine 5-like n=1 Tax=Parambassis ranga TaxID=210632 RepID=A0A6P7KD18_9TELE|nr:C-C motif chemokine 5-like [Parambassis ranga]
MKTLCFSVTLLLFAACCCDAMPQAVRKFKTTPELCCFKFSTITIPPKNVSDIFQTHSSCMRKAFIVKTIRGRQFCYSQDFQWAKNLFNQRHTTEGSGSA